jgi:hypothetical protein
MSISILNSYNPYSKKQDLALDVLSSQIDKRLSNDLQNNNLRDKIERLQEVPEKLITKNERNYFMKLFPDEQSQIEKHIVFNRNGRINESNVSKGILLDAKI